MGVVGGSVGRPQLLGAGCCIRHSLPAMGAEEESGGAAGSAPSLDPPRMVRGGSYQLHTLTQPA
jgi:hypothetical protein